MAYAACGYLDAYWELGPHPWDVAAGLVIGSEAGCAISGIWGNPFDFNCAEGIVLCAPAIHKELINAIKEAE